MVSCKNVKMKAGDRVKMVLRPEHIDIEYQDKVKNRKEDNIINGEVANALYTGSMVRYIVMSKGQKIIVDMSDPQRKGIFETGDKVSLAIPGDIHLLKENR
jgi:ABC-type Fe3+/spermidine/putrescine transport system ATPase subunit